MLSSTYQHINSYDPLVDWAADDSGNAEQRALDFAMHRSLLSSRVDELKALLVQNHENFNLHLTALQVPFYVSLFYLYVYKHVLKKLKKYKKIKNKKIEIF